MNEAQRAHRKRIVAGIVDNLARGSYFNIVPITRGVDAYHGGSWKLDARKKMWYDNLRAHHVRDFDKLPLHFRLALPHMICIILPDIDPNELCVPLTLPERFMRRVAHMRRNLGLGETKGYDF